MSLGMPHGFAARLVDLLRRKPQARAVAHAEVLDQVVRWSA